MKENNDVHDQKVLNDYLDPKFAFLRTAQILCNIANDNAKKIDETNFKQDNPIIFTQSYIITGEIILFSDIDKSTQNMALVTAKAIFNSTLDLQQQSFSEEELKNNPSKLLLIKDAKIRSLSSNQTTHLPVFLLFADQIVGFSFGHIE